LWIRFGQVEVGIVKSKLWNAVIWFRDAVVGSVVLGAIIGVGTAAAYKIASLMAVPSPTNHWTMFVGAAVVVAIYAAIFLIIRKLRTLLREESVSATDAAGQHKP
jgi:hypothetical protein